MGSSASNTGPLARLSSLLSSPLGKTKSSGFHPIAIDLGVSTLKVLQLTSTNPCALVAMAALETPRDLYADPKARLEFQLSKLPRLIREGGFRGKRAVIALPCWRVFCKHLQFAKQEGVPTAALIDAAVPAQLGCDPASIVHRHVDVGVINGRHEVIVTAAPREFVEHLVRGLTQARLEPVGIHTEFTCTLRAFDHVHRRENDSEINSLYLDLGAATTKVMISHGTALAFARVIEIGGRHLDETIAAQLHCSADEARQRRLATGATAGPPPRVAQPVLAAAVATPNADDKIAVLVDPAGDRRAKDTPPEFSPDVLTQPPAPASPEGSNLGEPLELLTDEISMCMRYHASQHPGKRVDRVVFVGGEARQRGLCQHLARALKMPGVMADPLARVVRSGNEPCVGVDPKGPQPGWAVAVGLSMSPTDL
jgi:Tfp pilus assembly PilM family ATPase